MVISVQSTTSTRGMVELVVCAEELVSAVFGGETGGLTRDEKGVLLGVEMSVEREMVVYVNAL